MVIKNPFHLHNYKENNLKFKSRIRETEFKEIQSTVITSLNDATKGSMELTGSSCLYSAHNIINSRIPSDLDVAVKKLGSIDEVKALVNKYIFQALKKINYTPFELKVNQHKTVGAKDLKILKISFKLNPNDPIEYQHVNDINIDLTQKFNGFKGRVNINGKKIRTLSLEEFVIDKIKALCQKTEAHFKNIGNDKKLNTNDFSKSFSRGNYMYDLTIAYNELLKLNPNFTIDIKSLKKMFERENTELNLINEIPNTYNQHSINFNQRVKLDNQVNLSDFDYYFNSCIELVSKIKSVL